MLSKEQVGFMSSFLNTEQGKRVDECLRALCGVDASIIPGEEEGRVCENLIMIQTGRRSVYNKLMAVKRAGESLGKA